MFMWWHVIFILVSLAAALTAIWPITKRWRLEPAAVSVWIISVVFFGTVIGLIAIETHPPLLNWVLARTGGEMHHPVKPWHGVAAFFAFVAVFVPFLYFATRSKKAQHIPGIRGTEISDKPAGG